MFRARACAKKTRRISSCGFPLTSSFPRSTRWRRWERKQQRYVASEDVTEKYIDTEARLKNAVALRDRLKALLNQAKDVKDVLEIEKELARVQGDIDSMEGRLKKLKEQVDYAVVDLTLNRRKILGPLGYIVYGVAWVIQKLFVIQ